MTKVIAALDNSLAARPVVAAATALAQLLGREVEALHVGENGNGVAANAADSGRPGAPHVRRPNCRAPRRGRLGR